MENPRLASSSRARGAEGIVAFSSYTNTSYRSANMQLSIVTPTFNEAGNVPALISELEAALRGLEHEIIVADDNSPDGTADVVERMRQNTPCVRLLRRTAPRSLSGAVIDGFGLAEGEMVACIDADMQHDPRLLPAMLDEMARGADLVVGSRYISGGGTSDWSILRRLASWVATKLEDQLLGVPLSDPMSGYFMLRRADFLCIRDRLNPQGFKILLEIVAHSHPQHIRELPYIFRARRNGVSKLSNRVVVAYLRQLSRLSSVAKTGKK